MFTIQASSIGLARARAARTTKTTRRSVSKLIVARASGVNAARLAPETASRTHAREVAQIAAKADAPPPPAKLFTEAQYVQVSCLVFTVYALQMLLVPAKMVTDHFHATADQMTQFWIRGSGCAWAAVVWAARQMDATTATTMMMATSFVCGILYPWNAKFNLFKNNLSVKYPMHYVPEILMAALSLAGAYLVYM